MNIVLKNKVYTHLHRITHPAVVLYKTKVLKGPRILYFGVPMHPNIGDLAQCVCIRQFISKYYPEYQVIEVDSKPFMHPNRKFRDALKKNIKDDDLIIFQSGYCTQDIGGVEDLMHQAVIEDYPNNRMVMMPQTILFKSEDRKQKASRIYDSHKHLLFLARDTISFKMALEMFPHLEVLEYPDIVTTLIGSRGGQADKGRRGIALCLRNDKERFYSEEEIKDLINALQSETVEIIDTTIDGMINANTKQLNRVIENFIEQLASYKLIITDRYHGTILSLVANTPVIVIKSNDHKVVSGVEWLKPIYPESIEYVDDLNNIPGYVEDMKDRKCDNRSYFEGYYYEKLPSYISQLMQ